MGDRRGRVIGIVVAAVGLVGVYFASPYVAVGYVARAIAGAATPEAEAEALCRANRWVHSGFTPTYSVATRDAAGVDLRPWQDGNYKSVAEVELTWSTGQVVRRVLLGRDGLGCVFGE